MKTIGDLAASALWILESLPSHLRYRWYRSKYDLADSFEFNGPQTKFEGDGEIAIGERSYLGRNSFINSDDGYTVEIGDDCAIGHYVRFYTSSYRARQDFSDRPLDHHYGDISIGDAVWIGVFCFISNGITIGDNTVVGANSTVTRHLPPHAICAGSPARVIRFKPYLNESDRERLYEEFSEVV